MPQELFSEGTRQSASGMPVTDGHPPGLVTADNWREYGRGSLGENVEIVDDMYLSANETINDAALIAKLKVGEQVQVSVGKRLRLNRTPGIFKGESYDAIQEEIRFDHLAHVEQGRAGDTVRAYFDSIDGDCAEQQGDPELDTKNDNKTFSFNDPITKKDIRVDSETHLILMPMAIEIKKLRADAEASIQEKEKLEQGLKASKEKEGKEGEGKSEASEITEEKIKKAPIYQAALEKMKAHMAMAEEMKNALKEALSTKKVQALVDERIKLIADAHKTLGADADLTKLDNAEIMRQVIKGTLKDVDVTDMSDESLAIYYEAAAQFQDAKPKDPVKQAGARRVDAAYLADQRNTLADLAKPKEPK